MAARTHPALGKGRPRTSPSVSRAETNTIPFVAAPPIPVLTPTVRKSRSFQWLKRNISENYTPSSNDDPSHSASEPRRDLSFGATAFLSTAVPGDGDKGKPAQPPSVSPKASPKIMSRRPSFWRKKRGSPSNEPPSYPSHSEGIILTLPPLPPVHQVSPFKISHLTEAPSSSLIQTTGTTHAREMSKSCSEINERTLPATESSIPPPRAPFSGPSRDVGSRGTVAPSPRARAQTNPPFFRRLSMGVFSTFEPSSPLDLHAGNPAQFLPITPTIARQAVKKPLIPKPLSKEESPDIYLTRLQSAVSKAEVAGILASSPDPFYVEALRSYINQFNFLGIPLDIALRKLLMEVGLPRETQQIDRVIEAFAFRYTHCNPAFFLSEDNAYVLAFSLIMLHTDAFNPSNKRKMTKQDYIKNTRLPGVPIEVLDYFFDNVVFAPFIFIEDPVDVNGQFGLTPDFTRMTINSPTSAILATPSATTFKIGNKVDPYYLIVNDLLRPLRVDVERYIPLESPYTYEGTNGPWNEQELHRAFVKARVIEIALPIMDRPSTILNPNPSDNPDALVSDFNDLSNVPSPKGKTWNLKITKCGLLNRKDDTLEGGKKSMNRKWKLWSVVLTGSRLLFFRDSTWTSKLQTPLTDSPAHHAKPPPTTILRPDELFSLNDSIAVHDRSYSKYQYVLRFVLPDGRHLLLQASDKKDLNEWISRINYASAFKSAGVRMRPLGLTSEDVHLTGVAAATSYLHDIQHSHYPRPHSWGSEAVRDLIGLLSVQQIDEVQLDQRVTITGNHADFELDAPVAPEVEGAEQFKMTFDEVKADLAAACRQSLDKGSCLPPENGQDLIHDSPRTSPILTGSARLPSRSHVIQSKIRDLDSRVTALRAQLDADSRCIRHIAALTPFQKSTRTRLLAAIQNMAKRVMQVRLDMEKLTCHRFVLHRDLTSESRLWEHSKQFALRSAKETLQSKHMLPRMTLSLHDDQLHSNALATEELPPDTTYPGRPESSVCGSFHSAVDFALDWPSSEDLTLLSPSQLHDTPGPSLSTSISSFRSSQSPHSAPLSSAPVWRQSTSSSTSHHELSQQDDRNGFHREHDVSSEENEEQAEEWNQTRCGHRVSLVRVPSNIGSRLKQQPLSHSV
ncbi:hypothetical protein BYT27DRAFT_7138610 [Phlegmacium glaucopus]|nr:hypothetical protein BYT27DRAFT_7138610 [Phlegmacium glaucopus]